MTRCGMKSLFLSGRFGNFNCMDREMYFEKESFFFKKEKLKNNEALY